MRRRRNPLGELDPLVLAIAAGAAFLFQKRKDEALKDLTPYDESSFMRQTISEADSGKALVASKESGQVTPSYMLPPPAQPSYAVQLPAQPVAPVKPTPTADTIIPLVHMAPVTSSSLGPAPRGSTISFGPASFVPASSSTITSSKFSGCHSNGDFGNRLGTRRR